MTYDLGVWPADAPPFAGLAPDDAYEVLDELLEDDDALDVPPVPAIADLVAALLARWPALGTPGDEDSPWATGPEIGDVAGPALYVTMTFDGARRAAEVIAREARARGLVCYDPQLESTI